MGRESRRAQFDRVHGTVLKGRTIRDLWLVYAKEKFEKHGIDLNDPAFRAVSEEPFYAGVATMFELMNRVAPDGVSEDVGVEMLNRLYEELDTYSRRGKSAH